MNDLIDYFTLVILINDYYLFLWLFFQGDPPILLTGNGAPIADKTASITAGPRGPLLLQDFVYLDEMAHFDRERIPERVVHAKGAGNLICNSRIV